MASVGVVNIIANRRGELLRLALSFSIGGCRSDRRAGLAGRAFAGGRGNLPCQLIGAMPEGPCGGPCFAIAQAIQHPALPEPDPCRAFSGATPALHRAAAKMIPSRKFAFS